MRKLVLLLFTIILLGAVKLPAAEWTVLVYMAADNGLNDFALSDINEMEASSFGSGTNVIVQIDESEYSQTPGAHRYKIHHDDLPNQISSPIVQELGEIDSGDYHSLIDFAEWGFDHYPATHKMLVLWSHGNSWYKGNATKWICSDNTSSSAIEVWNGDLKEAISSIPKMDILLFDACSMQSIEVLNEVYRNCAYVIGSEDLTPATGFPYTEILNTIHNETSPAGLAAEIPNLYVNSYNPGGSQNPDVEPIPVSCSYAVCSKFQAFRQQWDTFASEWKSQAQQFTPIRNLLHNFNDIEADVDLNEFLVKTIEQQLPELTGLYADATNLQYSLLDVFPQQFNNEYSDIQAGYATIWFPASREAFGGLWHHYGYLDFAETGWSAFLNQYNGPDTTPPLKPHILDEHQELTTYYVDWEGAPDPGFLVYDVWVRASNGTVFQSLHHTNQTSAGFMTFFYLSQTIIIFAVDEAGNRSAPDSIYCEYKEQATQMYFSPTPIHNLEGARLNVYTHTAIGNFKWEIFDITGKRVYEFHTPFKEPKLDTSLIMFDLDGIPELKRLAPGIYLSSVSGDGVNLKAKLVISK
jgi:hypothetical protein